MLSLSQQLAAVLDVEDAEGALQQALRLLAEHGIQEAADGPAAWLQLSVADRTLNLHAAGELPSPTERAQIACLLRLGLRRAQDEQALKRTRERMEMLSAASFEGLFFNLDGVVIDANQRLLEMLGASLDDFLGPDAIRRFVAPEDQVDVLRRVAEGYEGDYIVTTVRKDGSRFRAQLSVKQSKLGERPIRVAAVRDVTERERTLALLSESERRLRDLAAATFDVTVISQNGVMLEVLGRVHELTGYTAQELKGRPLLDFVAPSAYKRVARAVGEQLTGVFESALVQKDGSIVPVEVVAVLSSFDGEPVRVSGMRDLRASRRREAEHRALEEQMARSQRLESLGVLAGGIAHDFNNLLVGVLGNAELLLARLSDANDRAAAEAILTAAERAAALTAQMLAYAGRAELGPRGPIDISALLRELQTLLAATLSKKAELSLELADGAVVNGDRGTLTQVMMNLLTNASDALEDRPGKITARVTCVSEPTSAFSRALGAVPAPGAWVLVEIEDTGVGMDKLTQARVFEPFFTTKRKGHGLGLAACVGIITSHGGAVLVESELGKGSRFSVLLPQSAEVAPKSLPSKNKPSTLRRTVLVIDDQPVVRNYLKHALDRLGYASDQVPDGEAGLAKIAAGGVDLVILDMNMPQLNGAEVLARLRAAGSRVPVILISGYHDPLTNLDPKMFQGFLVKPFGTSQLAEALEQALAEQLS